MKLIRQEVREVRRNMTSHQKYWLLSIWGSASLLHLALAESFEVVKFWDLKTAWLLEELSFALAVATSIPIISKNSKPIKSKLNDMINGFKRKPPINVEVVDADGVFVEEKKDKINQVKDEAEEIRLDTKKCLDQLHDILEDMEDHSDYKDRQIIEDVVSNIVFRRRRMIKSLKLSENSEEMKADLDDFVESFQDLSQKEEAVLEEAAIPDEFDNKLKELDACRNRVERFLEHDYTVLENKKKIEEAVSNYKEKVEEIDGLEQKRKSLDIEKSSKELDRVKTKIEKLENSQRWMKYKELGENIDELKSEKNETEHEVDSSLQKVQRGMKKLTYQIENSELYLDADIEILKYIRDNKREKLLNRESRKIEKAVREAEEILPEDLLDDRQKDKFSKGLSILQSISHHQNRIEEIEDEIQDLKQEKQRKSVQDERENLKEEKKKLKEEIERKKSERKQLEEKKEKAKSEAEKLENKIGEILNSELNREVEIITGK